MGDVTGHKTWARLEITELCRDAAAFLRNVVGIPVKLNAGSERKPNGIPG